MTTHQPHRGDAIEAWIKAVRDSTPNIRIEGRAIWSAMDNLLDDYRLAADLGAEFDSERPVPWVAECCGTKGCDAPDCSIAPRLASGETS